MVEMHPEKIMHQLHWVIEHRRVMFIAAAKKILKVSNVLNVVPSLFLKIFIFKSKWYLLHHVD